MVWACVWLGLFWAWCRLRVGVLGLLGLGFVVHLFALQFGFVLGFSNVASIGWECALGFVFVCVPRLCFLRAVFVWSAAISGQEGLAR